METLIKKLTSKNIQPSHQRIKILEILEGNRDHPNVSTIFDLLCKEMPTISKTTVYNTLNTFIEKGLVSSLTITPEELRYDYITIPHHHLLCKRCGRIIDVEVQCGFAVKQEIDGHKIEEVQGYFKGICRDCLEKEYTDKAQK
jgi:Fe2+ or Zn2+ uptake regulation protein